MPVGSLAPIQVLDETAVPKQGRRAGRDLAPETGTTRRPENRRVGVVLGYAPPAAKPS